MFLKGTVATVAQKPLHWNPDITKCQGTGKISSSTTNFVGKRPKSLFNVEAWLIISLP